MTKQKPLLFPSVPNAPAYLRRMPTKAEVPAGMIVVHNNVRPPRIGSRGFRAWLAHPVAGYVRGGFQWAVPLAVHYPVGRGGAWLARTSFKTLTGCGAGFFYFFRFGT